MVGGLVGALHWRLSVQEDITSPDDGTGEDVDLKDIPEPEELLK
jgi:hypothetical protein